MHLLVGLAVHEYETRVIVVQILHLAFVQHRDVDLFVGPERAVDDRARLHILELRLNEGLTLTGLDVLVIGDREQLPVDVQGLTRTHVVRRNQE